MTRADTEPRGSKLLPETRVPVQHHQGMTTIMMMMTMMRTTTTRRSTARDARSTRGRPRWTLRPKPRPPRLRLVLFSASAGSVTPARVAGYLKNTRNRRPPCCTQLVLIQTSREPSPGLWAASWVPPPTPRVPQPVPGVELRTCFCPAHRRGTLRGLLTGDAAICDTRWQTSMLLFCKSLGSSFLSFVPFLRISV